MKLFFILKTEGGLEERYIPNCLKALGHDVFVMSETEHLNKEYVEEIQRQKPDFVVFFKLRTKQPAISLLKEIQKLGIPTVSWTFDLLIGHPAREGGVKTFPFLRADYVIMTDGGHVEEYKALGMNKILLRQGIDEEFCYIAERPEGPMKDILFVGTENATFPYRGRLLSFLQETYGDKFHWVGRNNSMECREHNLNKLYSSAKVIIGDCMYSEDYWSNRVYETLGRGGFLIHPRVKGMEKEFEWYKHLIPYDWANFASLKEKIDFYLSHDAERDAVRQAGFEHMSKNYLYSHRCAELVKILQNVKRN